MGVVIIMFEKKLYKDSSKKKVCGVLAGFSEFINADLTLLRIFFALLTIKFTHICIIIYFVCYIFMPDKNDIYNNSSN